MRFTQSEKTGSLSETRKARSVWERVKCKSWQTHQPHLITITSVVLVNLQTPSKTPSLQFLIRKVIEMADSEVTHVQKRRGSVSQGSETSQTAAEYVKPLLNRNRHQADVFIRTVTSQVNYSSKLKRARSSHMYATTKSIARFI